MGWWAVSAARAVLADPARARERQRTWTLAQGRAASWLARAHPQAYRDCYQQALAEVRAKEPGLPGGRAHERASRQARAELSAVFADEYAARFDQELAARGILVLSTAHENAPTQQLAPFLWDVNINVGDAVQGGQLLVEFE